MAERDRWVAIDASTTPPPGGDALARSPMCSPGRRRRSCATRSPGSWDQRRRRRRPGRIRAAQDHLERRASSRWASHPLFDEMIFTRRIADVRSDDDQVVLVDDDKLLWIDGEPALPRRGAGWTCSPGRIGEAGEPGPTRWGPRSRSGHSIQVFSAEHFSRGVPNGPAARRPSTILTAATCSGSSTSPASSRPPITRLALIEAAARVIEGEARAARHARRDAVLLERFGDRIGPSARRARCCTASGRVVGSTAPGWSGLRLEVPEGGGMIEMGEGIAVIAEPLPAADGYLLWRARDGRPSPDRTLRLSLLGDDRAGVSLDGRAERLSPRHSEIVALLALGSSGHVADARELAARLYGDEGKAGSVRVELSRLRGKLGNRLTSGSAALVGEVRSDYREVERLAGVGRLGEALDAYPGPLLPASRVPEIAERREALDNRLREAALASHGASALGKWLDTPSGSDDIAACRELVKRLDEGDPARPKALSRLRRIANA